MKTPGEAIISIRPNFAEAILSGKKTVEVRRRVPVLTVGTRLWIYATKPVGAVIGSAIVNCVLHGFPQEIWDISKGRAYISREKFDEYFYGTSKAVGIFLEEAHRCHPVAIDKLRLIRDRFHPPQVVLRISAAEAWSLEKLSAAAWPPEL